MASTTRRLMLAGSGALALALAASPASAQKKYDEGANDTEIKIGNTNPYSGLLGLRYDRQGDRRLFQDESTTRAASTAARSSSSRYDDGYAPPKTVEMVRKLVEQDKVLFIFNTLGTPTNTAIHKYLNQKQVPQLFVATGASKWGNPKEFPWTMGFQPDYITEAIDLLPSTSWPTSRTPRSPC